MTEAFNVVNIGEAKDGFLTIIRGEEAFTGAFEGGCFSASISKGDWDIAWLGIAEITEDWRLVASCAAVWEPVPKVWWSKTLVGRIWIIRVCFICICVGWLMLGGRWIIMVKKRLINFHLRNGSARPKCHLRCVICWVRRRWTEGLLVVARGLAC